MSLALLRQLGKVRPGDERTRAAGHSRPGYAATPARRAVTPAVTFHRAAVTPAALVRPQGPACGQPTRQPLATWQHGGVTAATHSTLFPRTPDSADAVLEGLDPEQRAVATALRGPVCVLAGAGTGKTRASTHRIAYGVRAGILQPRSEDHTSEVQSHVHLLC